jgi:tRNA G18 (ribose-2'-O)-methylase SpoU
MDGAGLNTIAITDADDPRLALYMNLKDAWLRVQRGEPTADAEAGRFIAEGELVLAQLVASRFRTESVLLTPARLESCADALVDLAPEVPIYVAERPVLEQIVGFDIHRGVLAVGVRQPRTPTEGILAGAIAAVILEDLSNHDNVGGLFRSVAALAGRTCPILLSPRCCDPLYRKAIRVSMGQALHVPFATLEPWPDALDLVRAAGFTLVALTPADDAADLGDTDLGDRPAFLLGAEGPGLSTAAIDQADVRVRIPIDPRADSLNVGVAGAIALHSWRSRARGLQPGENRGT